MDNISTLIATAPVADPNEPEDKSLATEIPVFSRQTFFMDIEELDTVTHVKMVMAMHLALSKLNKTSPAESPCNNSGIGNTSFIFG